MTRDYDRLPRSKADSPEKQTISARNKNVKHHSRNFVVRSLACGTHHVCRVVVNSLRNLFGIIAIAGFKIAGFTYYVECDPDSYFDDLFCIDDMLIENLHASVTKMT